MKDRPCIQSADLILTFSKEFCHRYLEADGIAEPPNDEHTAPGAVCVFKVNEFEVVTPEKQLLLKGTFELDASTSPKAITWVDSIGEDAGKELPAIYELNNDTFRFIAADEGEPRPTQFKTVEGLTMREFVRVG
jgi:uncharacterized protein (TIGR03067 family)